MTVSTGPLGIGIVGAGFIAESHAQAAQGHPGLRLAAVTDRNPVAAVALGAKYGATVSPDLDALLADPTVDIVIIGTPNDTHAELALATAAAGRHLLLEKPLALTAADSQQVVDAFAAAGRTLMIGHTHRHSDYARAVSAAVQAGAVGTPRSMRIAITAGWLWGNWGAWVLDPKRSGGHAFHNGVHLYDLAHWWMGSTVSRVFTMGQKITSAALQIDDALVATLEFENGSTAVCEISRGERPKGTNMFEIVIHGSTGTLVRRWNSDGTVALIDDLVGPIGATGTSPFARQLAVLHDAIVSGSPVVPDPGAAVHSIAIAEAVEQSSRTGEVVDVQPTAAAPTTAPSAGTRQAGAKA
jgi:predicted dehydrogenase